MLEGERPQERAEGGRDYHPVAEDLTGRPRPQHIAVVDAVRSDHQGMNQSRHLAALQRVTGTVARSTSSLANSPTPSRSDRVATRAQGAFSASGHASGVAISDGGSVDPGLGLKPWQQDSFKVRLLDWTRAPRCGRL